MKLTTKTILFAFSSLAMTPITMASFYLIGTPFALAFCLSFILYGVSKLIVWNIHRKGLMKLSSEYEDRIHFWLAQIAPTVIILMSLAYIFFSSQEKYTITLQSYSAFIINPIILLTLITMFVNISGFISFVTFEQFCIKLPWKIMTLFLGALFLSHYSDVTSATVDKAKLLAHEIQEQCNFLKQCPDTLNLPITKSKITEGSSQPKRYDIEVTVKGQKIKSYVWYWHKQDNFNMTVSMGFDHSINLKGGVGIDTELIYN